MKRLHDFEEYNYDNPFWHTIRYLRDHRDQAKLIKIAFDRPQHDFPPEAYPTKEQLDDMQLLKLVEHTAPGYCLTEAGRKVASYLKQRQAQLDEVFNSLRTLDEIRNELKTRKISFEEKELKSGFFRQPLTAEVKDIVKSICDPVGLTYRINPGRYCETELPKGIFVLVRKLDVVIPALRNPRVLIEVKEYWGEKAGGSKMSDAVYEAYIVTRELKDLEEKYGKKVYYYMVFDGKTQWEARRSDMERFLDLLNQGLIDAIFTGKKNRDELTRNLRAILAKCGISKTMST